MDQACAYGNRPVILTYDGEFVDVTELRVSEPLHFVIVDLRAEKDTVVILRDLQSAFPFAKEPVHEKVQTLLGSYNQDVCKRATEYLQNGDKEALGNLMSEANVEFYNAGRDICPSQLTAPVLHKCLHHPSLQPYILGGKGVGAGGDGTAQFLCRSQEDQEKVCQIVTEELKMEPLKLTINPASKIRKAVITAAGFNPGLFPAMKAVKPELFPVVSNGKAKPALLLNVEEILAAGIEKVYILVQPDDLAQFKHLFSTPISPQNFQRLDEDGKNAYRTILDMGQKIEFVVQEKQDGFGHAIAQCKDAIGGEPFLLVLGHHVYNSVADKSCVEQLIDAHSIGGQSVIGLKKSPLKEVSKFGAATGVWLTEENAKPARVSITEVTEKPSMAYARGHLRTKRLNDDEFLTAFGMYCIDPMIFEYLDHMIEHNIRSHGLIQFTDALEQLRQEHGLQGVIVDGERYNIGNPVGYLSALAAMSAGESAEAAENLGRAISKQSSQPDTLAPPLNSGLEAAVLDLERERAALALERVALAKERELVKRERERLQRLAPSLEY